tara:strand:+ start:2040 stop:2291 length:252 start_codon:yes stop_codon:yes gene_type:complete
MKKTSFEHNGLTFSAELVDRTHGSFFEIKDNKGEYVEGIVAHERDVRAAITYFRNRRDGHDVDRAITARAYGLPLQTRNNGGD